MGLFTIQEVRSAYKEWQGSDIEILAKSASRVLKEERGSFREQRYDVFLSHSSLDSEAVLGLCRLLRRRFGLKVYVDLDDEEIDSNEITPETAKILRTRMSYSRSLLYAASANATASKWMPWELGYFDGLKGAVAVVPITASPELDFEGQEYLGLYPYIDQAPERTSGKSILWVNNVASTSGYVDFQAWLSSVETSRG